MTESHPNNRHAKGSILLFINDVADSFRKFLFAAGTPIYRGMIRLFNACGFHLLRKHYYAPIPEEKELSFQRDSDLVGIDMNVSASFNLLETVFNTYKQEFNSFPHTAPGGDSGYFLLNESFMAIDGNVYYSFIRHLKPRKIVEIGSGNSTILATQAIAMNEKESCASSELICIEPYPGAVLRRTSPRLITLVEKPLQHVTMDLFLSLEPNDILFIDSMHVLKSGGDVWYEYCEILPRLKSGVYIHVHDISLPKPYPRVYFDQHLYWNEQYVLQAFLTYNAKFEVLWGGNYLMCHYQYRMQAAFSPEYDIMRAHYPNSEPTSFWMRVK